jgi:hypothetical protein
MTNDSPYPVLVSAGALVAHACLIEDGQTLSFVEQEFDPKEAAADPFGVGSITPKEVLTAIPNAIACRLGDHPSEIESLKAADLVDRVLQYTGGESRQVQDIRKLFVFYLSVNHVQTERVNWVFQAQQDLAEGSTTFEPKYRAAKGSRAAMSSATHIKLRAKVDGRAAEAAQVEAQMAQAARAEEPRVAQELAEQASAATPGQGSERRDRTW